MPASRNVKRGKWAIRVGLHVSIAGGVSKSIERAVSLGCACLQIFTHSPRQWVESGIRRAEAERFRVLRQEHRIGPVFIHSSYLINLASDSETVRRRSVSLLSHELKSADLLGAEHVVIHVAAANARSGGNGVKRAAAGITKVLSEGDYRATILLENTASVPSEGGNALRSIGRIFDSCKGRIGGVCIDTCHAFASGYDLRRKRGVGDLISDVESAVGLDRLKLIHLNDSRKPCGSGIDRHEHIGKGFIGEEGFLHLFQERKVRDVPLILETPKQAQADDTMNLTAVEALFERAKRIR